MKNKSQFSFEFLIMFGIAFSITMVMVGIFFIYFNGEKNTLDKKHIESIGFEFMTKTEQIYFLGVGNKVTLKTKFPKNIDNITIHHVNDFTLPNGDIVSFEYMNISYYDNGEIFSLIFEPTELYVRFNCSRCYNSSVTNISWYNQSDFSEGAKRIQFQSQGDWVDIDFVN